MPTLNFDCVAHNFDVVLESPVYNVENVVLKPAAKPLLLKPGQVVVVLAVVLEASLLNKNERLLLHWKCAVRALQQDAF